MIDALKRDIQAAKHFQYGEARRKVFAEFKKRIRKPFSAEDREFLVTLWPRLMQSRRKISTQLYIAFAIIVSLTLSASVVSVASFDRVTRAQANVNNESIPEMVAAFEVAQHSSSLVAAAPQIVTAQSVEDLEKIYEPLDEDLNSLESSLQALNLEGDDNRFQGIRNGADFLNTNIRTIRNQQTEILVQEEKRENLRDDLAAVRSDLDGTLLTALDDQLFYTMTGYREIGDPPDPLDVHFSQSEFNRHRLLSELYGDANIATELMGNAFAVRQSAALEPLKEEFEAAIGRINLNLDSLSGTAIHEDIAPIFERLSILGLAEGTGFNLLYQELRLAERQERLLTSNQDVASTMVSEVDGLVTAARSNAQLASEASNQAIATGITVLLVISLISIIVAALVGWLVVGRVLLRRIGMISVGMRRMAGGDLETELEVGGHDEITDMAAAVEVFRRHALEVQRLNLVELLANDLQEKNGELETALGDLRRAQDQIITQQKLASLGELTAGVAHEIRNPLNFIKNFSESSAELLDELQEVLGEVSEDIGDEQQKYIQEISDDLNDNMDRIRNHGERANRIVHDMLMMSRDAGEFQMTDVNRLVDEHSRLAYHSARATDQDFQLDLLFNLDPELGEMEVIPQDLGRVFLNMVSNACYATNERRRTALEKGESYVPTLQLSTRRLEDTVEISIRDNGVGIPPDVVEKMFNPFFTTKPTDQGTGLGLAISSDIVREHGGFIHVNSEPGEFTEMLIELPLARPSLEEEADVDVDVEEGAAV